MTAASVLNSLQEKQKTLTSCKLYYLLSRVARNSYVKAIARASKRSRIVRINIVLINRGPLSGDMQMSRTWPFWPQQHGARFA